MNKRIIIGAIFGGVIGFIASQLDGAALGSHFWFGMAIYSITYLYASTLVE